MKSFCHLLSYLLILILPAFTASAAEKTDEKPNVVLMLADNLGYGDVSAYNGGIRGGFKTPNIKEKGTGK